QPAGQPGQGAGQYGAMGYGQPAGQPSPGPQVSGSSAGFLNALFDFSFTSFVTPKVIKILYILIMILTGLGAAGFIASAFSLSLGFGLIALFILAPLFFLITIALYRIVLEFFIVVFRMSEDIRTLRDRGGLR
ncbi:MAG TPA: DUF4282 domain-containing protein, partial [Streptosporangiaceae bacterium]